MSSSNNNTNSNQWDDYYEKFDYFSSDKVREGCHPRIIEHQEADKAIVLVHGLTDSPYFMTAIANHFHADLGYNVYLPLLHFHGLKDPMGMDGVDQLEWKKNVKYAIDTAASNAKRISIGGLSTGGTLSFFMACTELQINGDLYLFSAALDLAGKFGDIIEKLLRVGGLVELIDKKDKRPLVGRNPYRYARMDMDGARELSELIKETDRLLKKFNIKDNSFPKRVFAAHSESDKTADIEEIKKLRDKTSAKRFVLHKIIKDLNVSHASLALKDPIKARDGSVLEEKNPEFDKMIAAITKFEKGL